MLKKIDGGVRQFCALNSVWVNEDKRIYAERFIRFLEEQDIRELYEDLFDKYNDGFGFTTLLRFGSPEYYFSEAFDLDSEVWAKYFNELWLDICFTLHNIL